MNYEEEQLRLLALAQSEDCERDLELVDELEVEELKGGKDGVAFGLQGHGLSSWEFRLVLKTARVSFDFRLPAPAALGDDELRERRTEDIRTVCRFAVAALRVEEDAEFGVWAATDAEGRCHWRTTGAAGEETAGEGWTGLLGALERLLDPRDASLVYISP